MAERSEQTYRKQIFDRYIDTAYEARDGYEADHPRKGARKFAHYFAPHLPEDRSAPILDLGCGGGGFLLCCRELGYSNLSGVDLSPEQIATCRGLGLDQVVLGEVATFLRDSRERYAVIVMSDLLEHQPKPEVVPLLESVRDHLRPGGRVIIRVPNLSNPLNMRTRYVDFTHEVGFTKESLHQVLRIAGFGVVSIAGEFTESRRFLARMVFDRILWHAFLQVYRRTLHLRHDVERGKNLIAVGAIT